MNIGENLKRIRKDNKMTQEDFGRLVGLSTNTVQRYELGKRQPTIEIINRIAEALGVSSADILYPTDEDKRKAVSTAQDILKHELYDKPAIDMLLFLLGQINDNKLKNTYSEKLKNNELSDKTLQLLVTELAKSLEYILYKLTTEK